MASLGVCLGACFGVRVHRHLLEALYDGGTDPGGFFPSEIRRVVLEVLGNQEMRPLPTYVGLISVVVEETLEFYLFVGSDVDEFSTLPCLCSLASAIQLHLRGVCADLLPEDSDYLLELLTVHWVPNAFNVA